MISPNRTLDNILVETQYVVHIDARLGEIVSRDGKTQARPSYIDDDSIAAYFFSLGTDIDFVSENTVKTTSEGQAIAGPRGTIIHFKILASLELNSGTSLFEEIGSTTSITNKNGGSTSVYYIDSFIKIMGATTGNSVDVPVRFIKKI